MILLFRFSFNLNMVNDSVYMLFSIKTILTLKTNRLQFYRLENIKKVHLSLN